MTNEQTITCVNCKAEYSLKENLHTVPVTVAVFEYVIKCPSCELVTHAAFETPVIVEARNKLHKALDFYERGNAGQKAVRWQQYQTARDVFAKVYHEEQKRWKNKRPASKA